MYFGGEHVIEERLYFPGCLVVSWYWHLPVLARLARCACLRICMALPHFPSPCTRLPHVSQNSSCMCVFSVDIWSKQNGFVHLWKAFCVPNLLSVWNTMRAQAENHTIIYSWSLYFLSPNQINICTRITIPSLLSNTVYPPLIDYTAVTLCFWTEAIWGLAGLETRACMLTALVGRLVLLTDGCLEKSTFIRILRHE